MIRTHSKANKTQPRSNAMREAHNGRCPVCLRSWTLADGQAVPRHTEMVKAKGNASLGGFDFVLCDGKPGPLPPAAPGKSWRIGDEMSSVALTEPSTLKAVHIAVVCHQANKAWCQANGDESQRDWHEAEQWQRDSAVKGVQFAIDNPDAPDSAQHDAWSADKRADGWIYGVEKNSVLKTHPCLVPFDQLPHFQQAKDKLFRAIVNALK